MNWEESTLRPLGLSNTSKKILSCLKNARSLNDVAKETGIPRTSVAYNLKELVKRGLVKTVVRGKRYQYIALSKEDLSVYLQKVTDSPTKESGVIIHIHTKEIVSMYERIMSLHKDERWKVIQPNKSWMHMHKKLTAPELIRLNDAISKNGIIVDALIQADAYKRYREFFKRDEAALREIVGSFTNRKADYTLIPEHFFNHNAEIWLFRNTFCIINWEDEVAVEINNVDMMHFMKDLFEIAKMSGQKVDHNQAIRDLLAQ